MTHPLSRPVEFFLPNLPIPPGPNHLWFIAGKRQVLSAEARTWTEGVIPRLQQEMRRQGVKPLHETAFNAARGEFKARATSKVPVWIVGFYQLATIRMDAEAPSKLMLDVVVEDALGINDCWVAGCYPVKWFAFHKPEVRLDLWVRVVPVDDKAHFNRLSDEHNARLAQALGCPERLREAS